MKKAVITTGGKQYLVSEGDEFNVEKLSDDKKLQLEALLIIDGDNTTVGQPTIQGSKIELEVIEQEILAPKVVAIRYKAKKRVRKIRGHRQRLSTLKVVKIFNAK